jgi:hypothetical protein
MRTARTRRRRRSAHEEIDAGGREKNKMSLFFGGILLASDGSEEAELAAGVAVELAKSTGAELQTWCTSS